MDSNVRKLIVTQLLMKLERVASVRLAQSILRLDLVLYELRNSVMTSVIGTPTRVMVRIVCQEVAEDLKVAVLPAYHPLSATQARVVCVMGMGAVMVQSNVVVVMA